MPKNIIICCDGTNNQFGPENTNVVRLIQALERDPSRQRLYYDPGVGTLPEPGAFTKIEKGISKLFGLAFGAGLGWKVQEAYSYLMDFWEPGDKVFLFGFSRGAYTARVLAGLLHSLGLLPRGNYNLVPYVYRLYKSGRKAKPEDPNSESEYWKLCNGFRQTFSRKIEESGDSRRFIVHFLGVWDTVSSVGWVWDPAKFRYTAHNSGIRIIRHAVSIDERRAFFRQNLMEKKGDQDFKELWFPGVHCDVGGGYPLDEGRLWQEPFLWILNEAKNTGGLIVNNQRLQDVVNKVPSSPKPWADRQHESLKWYWLPAEIFPKLVWNSGSNMRLPHLNLGRHRYIKQSALIHKSALMRIRDTEYNPPNFSDSLLMKIRNLTNVPDEYPFIQE